MRKLFIVKQIASAILIAILLLGCGENNNMQQLPLSIPLKMGINPSFQLDSIQIKPTNLVDATEFGESETGIQLELDVTAQELKNKLFLWSRKQNQEKNYPQVYGEYLFSLNISSSKNVELVVDTLSYDQSFFLYPSQSASIEDLTIFFKSAEDNLVLLGPDQSDPSESQMEYALRFSEGQSSEEIINFDSQKGENYILQWKHYKITIINMDYDFLKMRIARNN